MHTRKASRRSQSTNGVSNEPLRARIPRSLPAGVHWSNCLDKRNVAINLRISALRWRARWWTVVIFATLTSTLAAKCLASWPPVVEHARRRDIGPIRECQTRRGCIGVAVHSEEFAKREDKV